MVKRVGVVLVVLIFTATFLFAQSKTNVTIGGSIWNSKYTMLDEDGKEVLDLGTGSNFGPYLSISSGKLNLGASFLAGKYKVEDLEGLELTRNDLNVTIGYRVVSSRTFGLNLFGGVKYLKWNLSGKQTMYEWEYDWTTGEYNWVDYEGEIDNTMSGTLYGGGISAVIPFGSSGVYAYGSLAALTGEMKLEADDEDLDVEENGGANTSLIALNAGIGYRFASGLGINAGYRGDFFGAEDSDYIDRLQGFIATLSYTFQ